MAILEHVLKFRSLQKVRSSQIFEVIPVHNARSPPFFFFIFFYFS